MPDAPHDPRGRGLGDHEPDPPDGLPSERLLEVTRGHGSIETRLPSVRDVTLDEDRSQIRPRHAPRVMATSRHLAISLLRWLRRTTLAKVLRALAAHPPRVLSLLSLSPRHAQSRVSLLCVLRGTGCLLLRPSTLPSVLPSGPLSTHLLLPLLLMSFHLPSLFSIIVASPSLFLTHLHQL